MFRSAETARTRFPRCGHSTLALDNTLLHCSAWNATLTLRAGCRESLFLFLSHSLSRAAYTRAARYIPVDSGTCAVCSAAENARETIIRPNVSATRATLINRSIRQHRAAGISDVAVVAVTARTRSSGAGVVASASARVSGPRKTIARVPLYNTNNKIWSISFWRLSGVSLATHGVSHAIVAS